MPWGGPELRVQIRFENEIGFDRPAIRLTALWWLFLRISSSSFGGFMVMISAVQDALVERRKLLTEEEMLDGISLASVLPGPMAVNVVAYIGYRLRGAAGAAVCVCAAVLPSFVCMALAAAAYLRWGQSPAAARAFLAIVPVVAAVIVAAGWRMCRNSVCTMREAAIAVGAAVLILALPGMTGTIAALCGGALAGYFWLPRNQCPSPSIPHTGASARYPLLGVNAVLILLAALPVIVTPLPMSEPTPAATLFFTFAGMSLLMFGGGYVYIPLLRETVVTQHAWVTQQEFIDAIALGQVTPGPVMISAVFFGYKAAGISGAVAAAAGMFAPPAALIVLCAHLLAGIKPSARMQAVLRGLRAATAGMIFAAAAVVGKTAAPSAISVALFALALVLLLRFRVEAGWVVLAAGLCGAVAY
ncbi:chromate efflux transporter [Herbaspirillum sp. HC18]|nr:chromate efflux transporter [Herbaspirillum sp. HC18]